MKKTTLLFVFAASAIHASAANILVDSFTDTNLNNNSLSMNDLGWHSKTFWTDGPVANSVQSQQTFGTDGVNTFGIAQTISVASLGSAETGATELTLSFDWTPDATAAQAVSLELTYQLIAWDLNGGTPAGTENTFTGMNFAGTTFNGGVNSNWPSGTVGFDLVGQTFSDPVTVNGGSLFEHPSSGLLFPTAPVHASTAGVTSSFSQTFSLALDGNTSLADYDYVGVRFLIGDGTANSNDPGNDGGALVSNISLDATSIPEPSTSLFAFLAFGFLVKCRRR